MSDWIPVAERLPKQGEFVLTLDLERSVIEGHIPKLKSPRYDDTYYEAMAILDNE